MKFWIKIIKENNGMGVLFFLSLLITFLGLLSPIFIIHIFNRYIAFGLEGTLFFLVLGALIVASLEFIFRNLRHNFCSSIIIKPIKSIKLSALKIFFDQEISAKNNSKSKELFEAIDVNNNLLKILNSQNQSNIIDFFFATLIIFVLFFLNGTLATVFIFILFFAFFYQQKSNEKKDLIIVDNNQSHPNDSKNLLEILSKAEFLKVFNGLKFSAYNFSKTLENQFLKNKSLSKITNYENSMSHFLLIMNSIVVIGLGSTFVVNGDLTVGTLIGFNIFASRALQISMSAQRSFYNMKKINGYFKKNKEFFKSSSRKRSGMELNRVSGSISCKNMDFSFIKNSSFLFRNFNIKFIKGSLNVISGSNGSGKTVLCKIILGLFAPNSGEVTVDGTNLQKLSLFWWRNKLSYIPQNTRSLNSSIIDNISLGNPDLNNNEIARLIQTVGLEPILKKTNLDFEKKLDSSFSMGIHKKIHYARLLAKNSDIIIIDDPFENLDYSGKQFVYNLLVSYKKTEKTIICFSNDKEILNIADQRYSLDE